ncbi:MAG TPA: hypothetical protein VGV69_08460 [Solirubrobacterales bacterium]|nr:hypothetical protein [Solirubrobacterales bacterium]
MNVPLDRLSEKARDRARKHSKKLFGNRDTLLVAVAVAQGSSDAVNATELGWQVQLQANRVRAQLLDFVELGYMEDGAMQERTRWFVRRDSPFWGMCEQILAEVVDEGP